MYNPRRAALEDALKWARTEKQIFSRNRNGLEAAPGKEEAYQEAEEKVQALMELIQALESETVKQAIAAWRDEKPCGEDKKTEYQGEKLVHLQQRDE